jgi:hypothetical protein
MSLPKTIQQEEIYMEEIVAFSPPAHEIGVGIDPAGGGFSHAAIVSYNTPTTDPGYATRREPALNYCRHEPRGKSWVLMREKELERNPEWRESEKRFGQNLDDICQHDNASYAETRVMEQEVEAMEDMPGSNVVDDDDDDDMPDLEEVPLVVDAEIITWQDFILGRGRVKQSS